MDYDRAFRKVILNRWNKTPVEEQRAAEAWDRRGRLAPDDPDSYALYDSYTYQRGHIDVFREVYEEARHSPPNKHERLMVVDIGAGAATVAVALSEALGRSKRKRIDYLAFDPHPMMRKLGKRVLKHLDAGFRSAKYIQSLDDVDFTGTDRLLFTFSYVAHQDAVTQDDIDEWASLIKRAVGELDRAVELIYTTANLSGGAHFKLEDSLRRARIIRKQHPVSVRVPRRFPGHVDTHGTICWKKQPGLWNPQAGHWILST